MAVHDHQHASTARHETQHRVQGANSTGNENGKILGISRSLISNGNICVKKADVTRKYLFIWSINERIRGVWSIVGKRQFLRWKFEIKRLCLWGNIVIRFISRSTTILIDDIWDCIVGGVMRLTVLADFILHECIGCGYRVTIPVFLELKVQWRKLFSFACLWLDCLFTDLYIRPVMRCARTLLNFQNDIKSCVLVLCTLNVQRPASLGHRTLGPW